MSDRKSTVRAWVGTFSVLVIGAIMGIALDRLVITHMHRGLRPSRVVVVGPGQSDDVLRALTSDLGLSEQQAVQVHGIFQAHQASVDTAWTSVRERLESAITSVLSDLEAVLDDDQRQRLHVWMAERHGLTPD